MTADQSSGLAPSQSPDPSPGLAPVLDLGSVDGPVLCFGGPYSNVQATDAMLARARALGLAPQQIVCTGDVVAYAGDPVATVERVRDAGIRVVMGNCEESLGFNAADCGCGFKRDSACADWSEVWFAHAASQLDEDALAWMRALPRQLRFTLGGRRFAVIHGGDEDIAEYIFASTPVAAKARIFERLSRNDPPATPPATPSTPSSGAIPGCRLRRRWDPGYGTTRAPSACRPTTAHPEAGIRSWPPKTAASTSPCMRSTTTMRLRPVRFAPSIRTFPMRKRLKPACGRTWT